jgi:hypothetical protein
LPAFPYVLFGDAGVVACDSHFHHTGAAGPVAAATKKNRSSRKKGLTRSCLLTNYLTMDTSPASNPFTGLKGALAGLMSGGLLGLLLSLLFRRKIAPMLEALERLFAQFKAGTLPLPAVAAPVPAPAPAGTTARAPQADAAAAPRARRHNRAPRRPRLPVERRRPVTPARVAVGCHSGASRPPATVLRAVSPPPHQARCRKNAATKIRPSMPRLLRYRN